MRGDGRLGSDDGGLDGGKTGGEAEEEAAITGSCGKHGGSGRLRCMYTVSADLYASRASQWRNRVHEIG